MMDDTGTAISADDARLKKLRMRSWRRGMKEMDLILGPFSDTGLADLDPDTLNLYERMLGENDQDLYLWVTGAQAAPDQFTALLSHIGTHAGFAQSRAKG